MPGFVAEVDEVGYAHLHAVGQFILGDAGGNFLVSVEVELLLVELLEGVEHAPSLGAGDTGGVV